MHLRSRSAVLAVAALLAGCTGSGGSSVPLTGPVNSGGNTGAITPTFTGPGGTTATVQRSTIAIPGAPSSGFTYDLLYNDYDSLGATTSSRLTYLADRSNKAVDVFDMDALKVVSQIKATLGGGFAGVQPSPSVSGPNGPVSIPAAKNAAQTLYVSDGGHKIHRFTVGAGGAATENLLLVVPPAPNPSNCPGYVDQTTKLPAGTYPACATAAPASDVPNRIDEGSYDVADDIVAYNLDSDTNPSTVFIKGSTGAILGQAVYPTANGGTGYVQYDPSTKLIYAEISGSVANPGGELDVIRPTDIIAAGITPSGTTANYVPVNKVIPIPAPCSAAGMAINNSGQVLIGCDPPTGSVINTYLINLSTGAVVNTLTGSTGTGGADQVSYMPAGGTLENNRFFMANRRFTTSGFATAPTNLSPVLGVVSNNGSFIQNVPTSSGSHAVATDPVFGNIYVPLTSGTLGVFGPQT